MEYKIGDLIKHNSPMDSVRGVGSVVGFTINEIYEDILVICWLNNYEISYIHPYNVYKVNSIEGKY